MLSAKVDKKALRNMNAELRRLSKELPDTEDRKALKNEMKEGMKEAGEMVAEEARRRAPVGHERTVVARDGTRVKVKPGRLKKSIKVKIDALKGKVAIVAGVREKDRFKGSTATRYRRPYWAGWSNWGFWIVRGGPWHKVKGPRRSTSAAEGRRGRRVGRHDGARFMDKAVDAKAKQARRVLQRRLDELIRRYNRRIKRR